MAHTKRPPWLATLLEELNPTPAKAPVLPADTVGRLLTIEPVKKASRNLLADLARTIYFYSRPELIEARARFARSVESRPKAEVAKRISAALDDLCALLVIGDAIGLDLERLHPDWREHTLAIQQLRTLAEYYPMPSPTRPGRKPRGPHLLARRVAEDLAKYGIRPTEGATGTFGKVLDCLLGNLSHLGPYDLEHLTDAIVKERKGIVRKRRVTTPKANVRAPRPRGGISR